MICKKKEFLRFMVSLVFLLFAYFISEYRDAERSR